MLFSTLIIFWYIYKSHPELHISHSAFLPHSSIRKVEIYRSSKVKQTVHYTKTNLIYSQKVLAMPFINPSKDSPQRLLQSTYVIIIIQMPLRFTRYRKYLLNVTDVESAFCTTYISLKVTTLSILTFRFTYCIFIVVEAVSYDTAMQHP